MAEQDQPKIHVDADWKAQAQAEKQRLTQQSQQAKKAEPATGRPGAATTGGAAGAGGTPAGQMPPANFETLVSTMATQALFSLGAIPDPRTGQRFQHFDMARHHIDMLGLIEEKTSGNLSDDEKRLLTATLYELRQRYIQQVTASRAV